MYTIKIFARHNTTEKFAIACFKDQVGAVQTYLNETFGSEWLFVEEIKPFFEGVKFKDGLVYRGFHGKDERYLNGIINRNDPDIDLTDCLGCDFEFDRRTMSQDDAGNDFCPQCWKDLSPGMKREYDELKSRGEIE